jgi:hypothetical protein
MLPALLVAALIGCWVGLAPLGAATTERIVTDYHTGLALSGFDPVAYFIDSKAIIGRPELEVRFAGATWRFHNEGNRAEFAAHSEIYLPGFGGYDPMALTRGVAVPGHPEVWLIIQQRLYLFRKPETRDAFAADTDEFIAAAEKQWPVVLRTLVP